MKTKKRDGVEKTKQRDAARLSRLRKDSDTVVLTRANVAKLKRTPQVSIIRRALGLSQDEFASHFQIPVGTLRDWEQGRKEPDAAARAYLLVIGRNPNAVMKALAAE